MVEWLKEIGIYGKLSKEKAIPECVFRLPKNQLSLFLNRLFSCDGSIYRLNDLYEVSYSTSSEEMAKQIHHLLLRFGVVSRLRNKIMRYNGKQFPTFEIVIVGEFAELFLKKVGFYGQKETRQKEALKRRVNRNPNVDTIHGEFTSQRAGLLLAGI